jgi:predicted helicase
VLHSPAYRSRYTAFLKIDFPRIPLAFNLELFRSLAKLGGELVALHLLESLKVNNFITRFTGNGDNSIPKKPIWKDNAIWINPTQRFEGVPEDVWNFHIGGYQVCEKWLKDRKGRTLSDDDITHYQRIVVALSETIRIMVEIDKVIDEHGGWPGAFQKD